MEMLNEIGKRAKIAKYDVQKYTTNMKNEYRKSVSFL